MTRLAGTLAVTLISLVTFGCFEIEQTIELNRDLSGTASFKVGIDAMPMIVVMAAMEKEVSGDMSTLTASEIEKAKVKFREGGLSNMAFSDDPRVAAEKNLPPGVRLLDAAVNERDLGVTTTLKFAFEKAASLVGIKVFPADGDGDSPRRGIFESPFQGLEVSETETTVRISAAPQNPAEAVLAAARSQTPQIDPETEKRMNEVFRSLRLEWRITAPFEVVSTNATRREGATLVWEYDIEKLRKLASAGTGNADLGVNVTYRK